MSINLNWTKQPKSSKIQKLSNLVQRTLSSIFFVVLIIGPLFINDRIAYALYALFGALTLNELLKLADKNGANTNKPLGFGVFGTFVFLGYELLIESYGNERITLLLLALLVLLAIFIEIFRTGSTPFQNLASTLFAPFYTAISFLGIAYFTTFRDDLPQPWIVISLFALIWINDAAAYLVGRKIGKTKLIERLSPGKTIEGSLGGVFFAMLAAIGLSYIDGMPSMPVMIGFGIVCVVFGALGDLFESRIKRAAAVKDSGKFLPGHGGFFDRFDAMMFAIPAAILFFEAFLPKL
ncbi:MAG: phosphatidate cytidylyltransferase [Salibacteraceae bacterium]|nr:phosphatidate cytidylyltransferase [Salibacteraceae bacterium]MDP4688005.1 phosphatidate cytidylyltransferase [Salibacteraceae bacterium]